MSRVRRWSVWLAMVGLWTGLSAPDGVAAVGRSAYFLEFRSRPGPFLGHGYVVAGLVKPSGRLQTTRMAGLLPEHGECVLASLWGMRGYVGVNRDDLTLPPDERFRVYVGKGPYQRAVTRIDRNKHRHPTFSIFRQNCTTFVRLVAASAGLAAPDSFLQTPAGYVRRLREANTARRLHLGVSRGSPKPLKSINRRRTFRLPEAAVLRA